jgi:hypothetical protein
MDIWLHERKSMRSFYSREDEIMGSGDEETAQKISQLDDIHRKYTVRFASSVSKLPILTELDGLTSTCCHLCRSDAVDW